MRLRFGECVFDPEARELHRAGEAVALTPRAFTLLGLLLEHRPRALSHEWLRDALWPDTAVGYTSLAQLVTEVRKAVGDDARAGTIVRTVPRFGYAFAGEVVEEPDDPAVEERASEVPAGTSTAPPTLPRALSATSSREPSSLRRAVWIAVAAALAAFALLGAWLAHSFWRHPPPRFTQLTFRRGIVTGARFTRDGHTVVYSALWDGAPPEVFSRRLDSPASVSLGLPPAALLAVSPQGELALRIAPAGELGTLWLGTLARVPLTGGPVRPVLEGVLDADWSPDGRELAVIRRQKGQFQLEYPVGVVRLRPCPATRVRVAPDGERLAVLDDADGVLLIDTAGRQQRLQVAPYRQRLAWSPRGDAVLVDAGESDLRRTLRRVTTGGSVTEICALAGTLVVHDVGPDGRVLLHHGFERWDVRARVPGEPERETSAFANSGVVGLTADGREALLWYHGEGPPGAALLQPTRGGPPLRLGEAQAHGLSEDGRFALLETDHPRRTALTPTGPGESRTLPLAPQQRLTAAWRVDEHAVGFDAALPGHPPRSLLAAFPSGKLSAVTPEGAQVIPGSLEDGTLLARTAEGTLQAYSPAGLPGHVLPWRMPDDPFAEAAVRVGGDGRSLYVREGSVPARVFRVDLASGTRAPWGLLCPPSATGVGHVWSLQITPDGQGYAYTHGFFLEDLFLVDGL
ncbi:MAG TPA: winged helix-turn-helix domain-containing protein [Vicinamibacteria bacterium]|nr:winged helix-turn-helix domain-containing protein [Vicinamibacteria bacterium]